MSNSRMSARVCSSVSKSASRRHGRPKRLRAHHARRSSSACRSRWLGRPCWATKQAPTAVSWRQTAGCRPQSNLLRYQLTVRWRLPTAPPARYQCRRS
jgi:hypothetical protein